MICYTFINKVKNLTFPINIFAENKKLEYDKNEKYMEEVLDKFTLYAYIIPLYNIRDLNHNFKLNRKFRKGG